MGKVCTKKTDLAQNGYRPCPICPRRWPIFKAPPSPAHKQKRPAELRGVWSGKRDSNSRPRPWQGRALPTELFPQYVKDRFSLNGTAKIRQKSESPNFFKNFLDSGSEARNDRYGQARNDRYGQARNDGGTGKERGPGFSPGPG